MKKLIALALAAVMGLSLCACGGGVSANGTLSVVFVDIANNMANGNVGVKAGPTVTTIVTSDMAGKTIGVQNGTTGDIVNADEYEKDHGSKIMRYNKGMDAVQALKQGKVDAVIIDAEPAKAYVSSNEGLKILDDKFDPESYAFCLKKGPTNPPRAARSSASTPTSPRRSAISWVTRSRSPTWSSTPSSQPSIPARPTSAPPA